MDTVAAAYGMSTTGSVTLMNGVATGTDFTNRIGRKVVWKSFLIQGCSIPQSLTATIQNLGRAMLVYDSQPNGALPAITDVLLQATSTSPLNLNNRDRFKVLWDKRVTNGHLNTIPATSVGYGDENIKEMRKYRKISCETTFDGTAATIADIQTGSIFLLTIGTADIGTAYNLQANVRLRFQDA